jgi:hypothetical protein
MLRLLKSSGMNGVALEDVNSCGTKEQRNERRTEKKDKTKTKRKPVFFNHFWIYVPLHGIETARFDQDRLGTNAGQPPQQKNTHRVVAN